ncbi:transposase-like protein [Paraburkholderia youngii]
MGNPRARYTLEFMIEAVRMVRGGQSMAAVANILGISPKTLHNWVKADAAGKLSGAGKQVSPEQMEIARLRAELARVKMERDILEKVTARSTGRCNTFWSNVVPGGKVGEQEEAVRTIRRTKGVVVAEMERW